MLPARVPLPHDRAGPAIRHLEQPEPGRGPPDVPGQQQAGHRRRGRGSGMRLGRVPAADVGGEAVRLGGPPGARLVLVDGRRRRRGSARRSATPPRRRPRARTAWRRRPWRRRGGARRRPSRRRVGWWTTRSSAGSVTKALARPLDARPDRDLDLGAQPEAQRSSPSPGARRVSGGRLQRDEHLGGRHRQALARADEEGHALPAPGVDVQPHGGEGLDRGSPASRPAPRGSRGTGRAPGGRGRAAGSCGRPSPARRGSTRGTCSPAAPSRGSPRPAAGGSG